MTADGNRILWGSIFRRDLTEPEERDFFFLLDVLDCYSSLAEGADERVWIPSKDGGLFGGLLFCGFGGGSDDERAC